MSSSLVLTKRNVALWVGGFLLLAFQLRYAFESAAQKIISVVFVVGVLLLVYLLVGRGRGRGLPLGAYAFAGLYFVSCFIELYMAKGWWPFVMNVFGFILVFLYCYILFGRSLFGYEFALRLLLINVLIFVFSNLLLYFSGVKRSWGDQFVVDYGSGQALMLKALGFSLDRVHFILSAGVNSYSAIAALGLGLSVIICRFGVVWFLCVLSSVVSILLIDSRSAILYCFLALAVSWAVVRFGLWRAGGLLAFLIPLFPLAINFLYLIAGAVFGGGGLSRADSDAESIGGRSLIWVVALNKFSDFSLAHIFGYGNAGQVASGISSGIGRLDEFSNYVNAEQHSMHNVYLQALVNYGYVGLFVFLVISFSVYFGIGRAYRLGRIDRRFVWGWLFVFYLVLFFNNTEAQIFYPGQLFIPFLFLVTCFSFGGRRLGREW